jgi:hypothetical protein
MLDLFFEVLARTGSAEEAYQHVANEINKRRLEIASGDMSYEEAREALERIVDLSERLEKIKRIL